MRGTPYLAGLTLLMAVVCAVVVAIVNHRRAK